MQCTLPSIHVGEGSGVQVLGKGGRLQLAPRQQRRIRAVQQKWPSHVDVDAHRDEVDVQHVHAARTRVRTMRLNNGEQFE